MQYALVDGKRSQALKGISGVCEHCKSIVIAKCGDVKIHHWAHQSTKDCDHWWEAETPWHRDWKNLFPEEFREVLFVDKVTGEPHRADIHTDKGITIEFQNSPISPQEQSSREQFYQNIVWVVNGTRLKRDFPRFAKELKRFVYVSQGIFRLDFPEECFPQAWVDRSIPVIFDFLGTATTDIPPEKKPLYCLLPKRLGRYGIVAVISRDDFIKAVCQGNWLVWVNDLAAKIQQVNLEVAAKQQTQNALRMDAFGRRYSNPRRRRF